MNTTNRARQGRHLRRTMARTLAGMAGMAGMAAVAAVTTSVPAAAQAGPVTAADSPGCVSNTEYGQLSIGQRLSYVRSVVGDDAQVSLRRWDSGVNSYQERLYRMCTPVDSRHDTLTARFMLWEGSWRAQIIDTYVGPE